MQFGSMIGTKKDIEVLGEVDAPIEIEKGAHEKVLKKLEDRKKTIEA